MPFDLGNDAALLVPRSGLHQAKCFTEIHGGTLEIESTPGAGTNVTLTFPPERTVSQEPE